MGCDNEKNSIDKKETDELERLEKEAIKKERAKQNRRKRQNSDLKAENANNENKEKPGRLTYFGKLRGKKKLITPNGENDENNTQPNEENNFEKDVVINKDNYNSESKLLSVLRGKKKKLNDENEDEEKEEEPNKEDEEEIVNEDKNRETPKLRGKNISLKGEKLQLVEEEKETYDDFIDDCIEFHNRLRLSHNTPSLIENKYLTELAQKAAELLATNDKLEESKAEYKGEKCGENQYVGTQIKGEAMIREWYNGYHKYDFTCPEKVIPEALAFTQLVWKNSKEVGFGYAKSKNNNYYGVALYYPAGNLKGEFQENVYDTY